MLQLTTEYGTDRAEYGAFVWPPEVDLILSALDAGASHEGPDRRSRARRAYRTCAILRLFSDSPDAAPWQLFTRDLDSRSLGFITNRPLPLGYGGAVELPHPRGGAIASKIGCTIYRCRLATGDWYEGALSFNREQFNFKAE